MQLSSESNSLSWPISSDALEFARQVAQPLHPGAIADRAFDNAIAVATVHNFLTILEISSSYQNSALWCPVSQQESEVSNLWIEHVGNLECRAISDEADLLDIPDDALADCIGYVFVSFDVDAREAVIHGFLPSVMASTEKLASLRSVEYLLQHLYSLMTPMISITRWLSGRIEAEWQPWADVLECPTGAGFRAAEIACLPQPDVTVVRAQRAKKLDWQLREQASPKSSVSIPEPVVMAISACQLATLTIRVSVQLHPAEGGFSLSSQLQLMILDDSSSLLMSAVARTIDNYLELQFKGIPGEVFQVRVTHDDYWACEMFQL